MIGRQTYEQECDEWFERNRNSFDEDYCSKETKIIEDFCQNTKDEIDVQDVLEIGEIFNKNNFRRI